MRLASGWAGLALHCLRWCRRRPGPPPAGLIPACPPEGVTSTVVPRGDLLPGRVSGRASLGERGGGSDGAGLGALLHGHGERVVEPAIQAAGRRTRARPTRSMRSAPLVEHSARSIWRCRATAVTGRRCGSCWAGAATLSPHRLWRSTSPEALIG